MAISTEAELCNLSLGLIGVNLRIQSLNESSAESRACRDHYFHSRDITLESAWWNFAEATAALVESSEEYTGWGYAYHAPNNMRVARFIDDGVNGRAASAAQRVPFKRVLNADGSGFLILTDMEDAELVYTRAITNPSVFTSHFVEAVAWNLAARLSLALKKDTQTGIAMSNQYRIAMAAAKAHDSNEGQEDVQPDSIFITAR